MPSGARGLAAAFCAATALLIAPARAQPGTIQVADQEALASAAWLAGRWVGEGLGGQVEEMWSPLRDGQMVGHFILARTGKIQFYELLMIDAKDGALRMRVKHFNPDFTGWEKSDGWHTFEPISAQKGDLRFEGLSLQLDGAEMVATVRIRNRDQTVGDNVLRLRRAPL